MAATLAAEGSEVLLEHLLQDGHPGRHREGQKPLAQDADDLAQREGELMGGLGPQAVLRVQVLTPLALTIEKVGAPPPAGGPSGAGAATL